MNDLNPVPHEPGVEFSEIVTATFARFMPASILGAFGIVLGRAVMTGSGIPEEVIQLPLLAALLTAGFGFGLLALRRFLRPDADVGGGLSVIAGVASPFTYGVVAFVISQFSVFSGPLLIAVALSALFLVGAVWQSSCSSPGWRRQQNRETLDHFKTESHHGSQRRSDRIHPRGPQSGPAPRRDPKRAESG